ncbi:hypothetical protein GJW-30_1_03503 [Variibacter gotjawalensis]|uniref:Sulfur globule protein n=1 Tax=Variibacter gotjawalensis TaxID=1333996 RepID=A0A0S3PYE4_9BRAD|nr:hypothetical protein [Variibacter gotjawalensis]NIK46790.1 hypothetical protein [Variibacter gotjawalensis]RZS48694.1 hypothetical protein EV661_1109 [Variibacter gotjawalensis]BAT60953.1 hypothetical protein GJW-30_1_03503 [Variibacter gotjawalensis]
MIRKTIFALAALAAVTGAAVATSSDASAKGFKGGYKGGFHGHHHHGGHWGHRHFRVGFYGPAYSYYAPDCVKVITPRGYVKRVCYY